MPLLPPDIERARVTRQSQRMSSADPGVGLTAPHGVAVLCFIHRDDAALGLHPLVLRLDTLVPVTIFDAVREFRLHLVHSGASPGLVMPALG